MTQTFAVLWQIISQGISQGLRWPFSFNHPGQYELTHLNNL